MIRRSFFFDREHLMIKHCTTNTQAYSSVRCHRNVRICEYKKLDVLMEDELSFFSFLQSINPLFVEIGYYH